MRKKKQVVDITVVNDLDNNECLYENGKAWSSKGETTVYVSDLVHAANGRLIALSEVTIEFVHEEWPDLLSDAIVDADYLTAMLRQSKALTKKHEQARR